MSATSADALSALRSAIGSVAFTIYWQGDDKPILPDEPAAFAYAVFDVERSSLVSFGGGVGNNTYRNEAVLSVYVFYPDGEGAGAALAAAETVATKLRSHRDSYVSCFDAKTVLIGPNISIPGIGHEVNNYQCAVAEISLYFDTIG